MTKRIISLFLALCLLLALMPQTSLTAQAVKSDTDIAYAVTGGNIYFDKATGKITGCDKTVTAANIPAQIDGVVVTCIGDSSFEKCSKLTSVTIPDSVTSIANFAFRDCTSLTGVTIPDSVTSIGICAFCNCSCLASIIIPNSVSIIYNSAFWGCSNLTSITIPSSVTRIDSSAFGNCKNLVSIRVNDRNPNYSNDKHGVLFNKDKSRLLQVPSGLSGSYVIPTSVTSIGNAAFEYCAGLTSITIPNSVTVIENSAFMYCDGLTNISIPDSVTCIEYATFICCSDLANVTIGSGVTSIGRIAFQNCTSLTGVFFHGDAPSLGSNVFDVKKDGKYSAISGLTLYYIEGKEGWTSPTWNSYPTATWDPNHVHSYTAAVTAPTCTELGYTTHSCACGDSYVDTYVDALGHDHQSSVTKEPSCTEEGVRTYTCSRCGDSYTEAIDKLAHSYTATVTNPTCTELGYTTHSCACGDSYVDTYVDALGHDHQSSVTKEPSCTEEGVRTYTCSRCGDTYTEAIDKLAHNYTATVTKPTCTDKGYTTYTCQCGDHYIDDQVDALGHDFVLNACARCGAQWSAISFSDVSTQDWFYDYVMAAARLELVTGYENGTFLPGKELTRAEAAILFYRLAGSPAVSGKASFQDLPDAWYQDAIYWAQSTGVVNGVSATEFQPGAKITREAFVTMLWRYANKPAASGKLSGFPDTGAVQGWAQEAFAWAVEQSVINGTTIPGKSGTWLAPQESVIRAQAAKMLVVYAE